MALQGGEDVYATLLLTDTYLPGALVLAHSIRDAGTTKKLAVLVTLDTVSAEVVTELKKVYDYVIPVPRVRNERPANLHLMDRPDLHSAFTKINLWRQTQFRKIVYIDADVVAYRAPDELFDLPHAFSAAPDIGWPDLFNTGVMALTPNMGDYYALMAMAERGISFDGADQGLLNMYYKNGYNRLSFSYNVTPSAHYQYIPAYRHFQSTISMIHFIGTNKPWFQGRNATTGSSPFNEMVGRWWAVYDRHYRNENTQGSSAPSDRLVQYFVKGEYQPRVPYVVPVGEPQEQDRQTHGQQMQQPPPLSGHGATYQPPFDSSAQPQHHQHHHHQHDEHQHHDQATTPETHYYHHHEHHDPHHQPQHHHHHHHGSSQDEHGHHEQTPQGGSYPHAAQQHPPPSDAFRSLEGSHTEARKEQVSEHHEPAPAPHQPPPEPEHKQGPPPAPPAPSWDAQWQPPPVDSKPEALNFPHTRYEMSSDPAPFVPPERYPSPPRDMWYEVPKAPPAAVVQPPRPIFPWETHQPRATRVFGNEPPEPLQTDMSSAPSGEHGGLAGHGASTEPSVTEATSTEQKTEDSATPTTPTVLVTPSDPWSSFTRTNAWDEVPQIERYVDSLQQKHRRIPSHGGTVGRIKLPGPSFAYDGSLAPAAPGRRGSKLTDFPSEVERPSLPVTPAPIRRPKFWGGGGPGIGLGGDDDDDQQQLPSALGVPTRSDWDPVAQLQKLAKQQSELLLQKLGGGEAEDDEEEEEDGDDDGGSTNKRSSSAGGTGAHGREIPNRPMPFGSEDIKSPTYVARSATVLSPKPVKPDSESSPVLRILKGSEHEAATPRITSDPSVASARTLIDEPSYSGPGVMFEKGEFYPTEEREALPTEEEEDVLET